MRAYKFLSADGLGVFSRFAWPLPGAGPGTWVESDVETCRAGIHACRPVDLPYWLAPALYEVELDGPVDEQPMKVVAPRGRLLRRIDAWDDASQHAFAQMCLARADELAAGAPAQRRCLGADARAAARRAGAARLHRGKDRGPARGHRRLPRRAGTPERMVGRAPGARLIRADPGSPGGPDSGRAQFPLSASSYGRGLAIRPRRTKGETE